MKTQKWYYMAGSQRVGPLTFDELKAKNIQAETQVYCALLGKWTKASSVEELGIENIPSAPLEDVPPFSPAPGKNELFRNCSGVCLEFWRKTKLKIQPLYGRWQGFDSKTKIAIGSGTAFVVLIFYFLLPGRNQEVRSGQVGYRGVIEKIEKIREVYYDKLLKKYGSENDIPKEENQRTGEEIEQVADKILASCKPVPAAIDVSAKKMVAKINLGNPTVMRLGFFGWKANFPVTLSAISQIPKSEYANGLVIRVYDSNGAALEEDGLDLNADAISGESVTGRFSIEFAKLENMKEVKLFSKSKESFRERKAPPAPRTFDKIADRISK